MGRQSLDVIRQEKENFQVVGLTGGKRRDILKKQIEEFSPLIVALADPKEAFKLKKEVRGVEILEGEEGIKKVASFPQADFVLSCIGGRAGLFPTLEAIRAGKDIGLANKESVVIGGEVFLGEAREKGVRIIPLDSEESAIFQCLEGKKLSEVKAIYLTASGGPFLKGKKDLNQVTPEEALSHPRWKMGPKISIDSATLINKSLEIIETKYLFGVDPGKIKVLIHPQSVVHGLVEFKNGIILAQLAPTDMRFPIHYALHYPETGDSPFPSLDLCRLRNIEFESPSWKKFPSLRLGYWAAREGRTFPPVLSGADEVAVEAFLKGKIPFSRIVPTIEKVMELHSPLKPLSLGVLLEAEEWARKKTKEILRCF